jgi:hypothetical protein
MIEIEYGDIEIVNDLIQEEAVSTEDIVIEDDMVQESWFTNTTNVKKRISTVMNDALAGFKKIHTNISQDRWTKKDFMKFWRKISDGKTSSYGFNWDNGDFTSYSTYHYIGDNFYAIIYQLTEYVKIAHKRNRAKSAFNESDLNKLESYYNDLKEFTKLCDKAMTGIKRNDYSLADIDKETLKLIDKSKDIQKICESDNTPK